VQRLADRFPAATPEQLLGGFVPPPRFAQVRFASYLPGPDQPTQAAAVAGLEAFAARAAAVEARRRVFRRAAPPEARPGIYLDGGFGVGKTHLLASLFHALAGPAAFGTFVEYTHLVGALGFAEAVARLDSPSATHRKARDAADVIRLNCTTCGKCRGV